MAGSRAGSNFSMSFVSLDALLDALIRPDALEARVPLLWQGARLGSVAPAFADYLDECSGWMRRREDGLHMGMDAPGLEAAWQALARQCRADGWAPAWREEDYDLFTRDGRFLCRLERGVFRPFGLRARAVHVNGHTADGRLWIGRRAMSKAVDPGCLDNVVGGGMAAGEQPQDCLLRECWEEAGIPAELAARARHVGTLDTLRPEFDGLHDERIEMFDLELPDDFRPDNQDGEVAEFCLLDPASLAEWLLSGRFTVDAAGVSAHWLRRQTHPD